MYIINSIYICIYKYICNKFQYFKTKNSLFTNIIYYLFCLLMHLKCLIQCLGIEGTHYITVVLIAVVLVSFWPLICSETLSKAHHLLRACVYAWMLNCVWLCATSRTVAHQAPLSMELSRQEYWSGLSFPSPGIFPTQGSNLCLLHWQAHSLPLSHQRSPQDRLLFFTVM